jgi:hypothetical protein
MCKIVHRVNTPFVAGAVMMGMFDAVNDRVTHQHIGEAISILARKTFSPSSYLPAFISANKEQVFFNAAAPEFIILSGFSRRAF